MKRYPAEAVRFIADTQEFVGPMTPKERENLLQTMRSNLKIASTEFDYQALYEGMSARYFQLALEEGGEPQARELANRQLSKFLDRYDKGLNLSEGSMKLATTLSESIKEK